jgi:type IV pilus assembly protein PilA
MLKTARRLASNRSDDESGFTLIELMVVVLIIAVLMAIAIPTFLGAQNKAKDRSAQSSLRNTVTSAKVLYADTQKYSLVTSGTLGTAEPALTFQLAASTTPKQVSVMTLQVDPLFYAAAKSDAGTCYAVKESSAAGTQFGTVTTGVCTGDNAAAAGAVTNWADKW